MTSTITIPGTALVSNDPSPTGLLSLATLFGAGPMIPTTLKAVAGHLSTEAPDAFSALQKCNTAAEGMVLPWPSSSPTLITTLLTDMVRFQGTNLRALAEKAGSALVEQSLPLYATQGRCAVEVQLNAWSLDKFCPWHDHDCKELGLIVVQGNLLEERWVRGKILRRLLQPGELVLLEPSTIHRLGGGKAVTLHAYGGGLRRMTRYQCGADGAPLLAGGLPAIEAVWAR